MRSLLSDNVAQELGDLYAGAFDRFVFDYRVRHFLTDMIQGRSQELVQGGFIFFQVGEGVSPCCDLETKNLLIQRGLSLHSPPPCVRL